MPITEKCSLCNETISSEAKSVTCKCGHKICHYCRENSEDFKDKSCSFSETCTNQVVRVCFGCGDWPLCETHMFLNAYCCTNCAGFACEECFVENFEPNTGCKSKRGCIACGACEMWDASTNPRKKCHNCRKQPSKACLSCAGGVVKCVSCDNCREDCVAFAQTLAKKEISSQAKCGYHPENKLHDLICKDDFETK